LKKDTDRNLYAFISHNFKRIQHDRHRMNDKEFHNNIIILSFLDNYKQSFYIGSLIVKKLILSIVITRRSKRKVKARGETDFKYYIFSEGFAHGGVNAKGCYLLFQPITLRTLLLSHLNTLVSKRDTCQQVTVHTFNHLTKL